MSEAPADILADLEPEFQVIRQLGTGTVARVLLARETELKRLVAIKIPHPEIVQDSTARRRFEREASSAAKLIHPNIASVHRVGHLRDGTPFIVMRYAEGRTLEDVLRSTGPLDAGSVRAILLQLASALAEAHRKGVIHRDLRPGNVVWTRESNEAVLMDFGLAAVIESGSVVHTRLTRTGQQLGDLEYMSPEQFRQDPVTPATDIYSLGILGYELLTGQGPYRVGSRALLGEAHLNQAPLKLTSAPRDLAQLLESCLAKNPAHRPTATDLVHRLSAHERDTAHGTSLDPVEGLPALIAFIQELKRRRVFNVGLLYLGGAVVVIEAANAALPSLHLNPRANDVVVALVLAGFPVALVLTWIFEIRGGRVLRTEAAPGRSRAGQRIQLLLQGAGLLASLLLAALIGWWILGH
jgi:eukaryotic-like serine/threonine-protein kinase